MAFPAIAAMMAGEAATASMVLTTVSSIGAVTGVVGAVTGNKDLMKVGGIMGLVGGVGGMMSGLGAAKSVAGAANGSWDAAATGVDASGINAANTATTGANTSLDTSSLSTPTNGIGQASQIPDLTGSPTEFSDPWTGKTNFDFNYAGGGTQAKPSGGFFDGLMKWANDNKTLANGAMQLGGGLLKGMNEGNMFDRKLGLEQQRLNQSSYGNQVANFNPGIIQQAGSK